MAINGEVFGQLGCNLEDVSLREWMYESLYGNLEESFSSRGFHEVVSFSTKWSYTKNFILFLCGNASSDHDQPQRNNGNEEKKRAAYIYIYIFSFIVQVNFAYFSEIFCL